jgi:8-oxo-dGTP pyrophosphatase MutT (NUDIX family)
MERNAIATPHPAATVMLLRDRAEVMEVFMIVRHPHSDVHAGALVFPGGRVDSEDYRIAVDPVLFPMQSETNAAMAVLRVAAVRETYEECGVLLARERGKDTLLAADRLREIDATHRAALSRGERTFGAMLKSENLVLAPESMVYFAHWITPERSAKRFDTHFFLAAAPSDQVALHDGHEAVDSVWIAPAAALQSVKTGTYELRFPTQMNLQKLGRQPTTALAMKVARESRVVSVMTKQVKAGDGMRILRLPPEADYGGELFEVPDPPAK